VAHAGESGDGVEQPPATRRERRVDAGVDLLTDDGEVLVGEDGSRGAAAQQPRGPPEPVLAE